MCKGLAVITEKIGDTWEVHAKEGITSHDDLLHEMRDDLRYGRSPHIKFEVYFPMVINDDIQQDVAKKYYPKGWVELMYGRYVACPDAVSAVAQYLAAHKELLNYNPKMLHNASLNRASLNRASLDGASLKKYWKELKVTVFAGMYINFEYKTRKEIEKIVKEE